MLKIKGQIELKSLRGIFLTPNVLYDRIGVYYRVMNLQISAEDFLHLLNRPPDIYLSEGDIFHLTVNNDTRNQYLKMEFINQLLNRILLLENQTLSYQDSIFVSTMLRKTGIRQTGKLLSDIRQTLKEHQTIKKLTDMYQNNGMVIREVIRAGGKDFVSGVQRDYEQQYGKNTNNSEYHNRKEVLGSLSSAVYQRLRTEEIYNEVYERTRQYGTVIQNINNQELNMAEQVRVSGILLLTRLRKECTFRENGGTELYINPYEAGAGKVAAVTRETVLSEILSAAFLGLANNICQIRREQMVRQVFPQFRIVQSLCHSMENMLNRYEFFHTRETWQSVGIYPFLEDNRRLSYYEINLLEELVRNNAVMQLSAETIQSARWQQALINYLGQREEYNLSEAVSNAFMEYRQEVQSIHHKTEQDNIHQINQIKNNLQKAEKYDLAEQIRYHLSKRIKHYLSVLRKLQLIQQAAKEKQEIINEIVTKIICEIVSGTIKDISAKTFEQQNTLVKELLEVRKVSEIIKEIGSAGYTYGYPRLADRKGSTIFRESGTIANIYQESAGEYKKNSVSEYGRLWHKLNLTYYVVNQWSDNEEVDIFHPGLKAEGSQSDDEIVFIQNNNTDLKEKAVPELQQIIQKEKLIRNTFLQYNEYQQQYQEKTKEISDTEILETEEIQKQWQNREMLRQLQEINQKNIEINQKYRKELQQRSTSVSHLQVDGRKTINEALKIIHNPQNNAVETIDVIQKNPLPSGIDEEVRKLASKETVEIFETILGIESGFSGESGDRISQKRFVDTGEEEKRSIKIHRRPEAALQWEIREIEQQMERQTKQQSSVMRTRESIMPLAGTQEKFGAAGDSPGPLQNPLQAVTFIHKEQNNLTEEALLPYLRQYRHSESTGKNSIKETVVNHGTEMKEISRKKNQAESQSKEEVEELIRRNLQRQMETITDRVINRIEKKLQMERRRRGY